VQKGLNTVCFVIPQIGIGVIYGRKGGGCPDVLSGDKGIVMSHLLLLKHVTVQIFNAKEKMRGWMYTDTLAYG
jgi:hypothetical protein